jgi:hypothetical protein
MVKRFDPVCRVRASRLCGTSRLLRFYLALIAAMAGLLVPRCSGGAAPPASAEYQQKAGFTIRFLHFVEWPAQAVAESQALILGVLGSNPFDDALQQHARGQRVGQRTIEVRQLKALGDALQCHAVFISRSETNRLSEILTLLEGKPILTIGDTEGFAERGVIINMFLEDSRVRFEINQAAAAKAHLQISSKLLRLAKVVGDATNK